MTVVADLAVALLEASWVLFGEVVARTPGELRKGPRGEKEADPRTKALSALDALFKK